MSRDLNLTITIGVASGLVVAISLIISGYFVGLFSKEIVFFHMLLTFAITITLLIVLLIFLAILKK